jgi:sialate O-acetylesterase
MDVVLNNTVQTIEDIMVGEVVLLAGQSNAEWPVKSEKTTKRYPDENAYIRFAIAGGYSEEKRCLTGISGWQKKTKESIGKCSAIGRHLAEMIYEKLGVAVGIICCYKGASIIQAWTNKEVVQKSKYYLPKKHRHLNYELYGDWNEDGFLYDNIFKNIGCYRVSLRLNIYKLSCYS